MIGIAFMTLNEIKSSVESGERVFWKSQAYEVIKDRIGQWLLRCSINGNCIGLTWADGQTLNGKAEDFYKLEQFNHDQTQMP